jgi:hypothetical protein
MGRTNDDCGVFRVVYFRIQWWESGTQLMTSISLLLNAGTSRALLDDREMMVGNRGDREKRLTVFLTVRVSEP